ncbi:acetyl-CoA acetyltransferase [Actinomycetospora sp. NBRC 106375]|uniref:acetyl-CoA C-acetyltransferase n=1 Tax=Actinomycetospora sp. NBRC 106375 TaxID=3032207 RepID=UPI0024A4F456|nr:acetyl-CoA C-acetyltransferase [Actinomycetospora sp. NBRC 106375]GLZ45538.1 acetyl-CoA acetyltransferase [Actinomycetospora sp. NBRC 106375]
MPGSVIVSGKRTPIGKLSGAFAGLSAGELGTVAIKGALEAAGISGEQVEYVIMGQVIQAGAGQNPARKSSTDAGIPMSTPSFTLNKVCLSGLDAIALADQMIQAGEYDVVVAGGMESMTQGPYLLPKARGGYKYGGGTILDATESDGLTDAYDHESMGASTERFSKSIGLKREDMDAFAASSHQRAADAAKNGRFDAEIVGVPVPQRKGDPVVVTEDEGVRGDTTAEGLGKLRPAFDSDGAITAGTSSQISDGAAATVVMSEKKAKELGLGILARIGHHGWVAGPDNSLLSQPSNAIQKALKREDLDAKQLEMLELNEAFAAVALQSTTELGVDPERVNPDGGAIALGHPVGASGARIAIHIAHELQRRGGGIGAAGLCGGGGQGSALVLHV